MSHAAPAHHFGDKTGLLTAVATDGFTLFIEHLAHALAKGPRDLIAQLGTLARAYADFADRHPGHVEVMFRPGLTRVDDPDYDAASHAAFGLLHAHIIRCQGPGGTKTKTRVLAAAAWSLAHGITVLRAQGSLGKHYPDDSLAGVVAIVDPRLELISWSTRRPSAFGPASSQARATLHSGGLDEAAVDHAVRAGGGAGVDASRRGHRSRDSSLCASRQRRALLRAPAPWSPPDRCLCWQR